MTALDELAEVCGIAGSSKDAFGNEHTTTPELKKAILNTMGFPADDEQLAAQTVTSLQDRSWSHPLPPVLVTVKSNVDISVPLVVSAECHEVAWNLKLEDGDERAGHVTFGILPTPEQREIDGRILVKRVIALGDDVPLGYHRLRLHRTDETQASEMSLIVSPGKCWLPDREQRQRYWGIAVNLPLLRSSHNWGIGDFTDLRALVELSRARGASAIGLNPLHAMFLDSPGDASPYSPSDRLLLNVLNIDVEAVPELQRSPKAQQWIAAESFQQQLSEARSATLVAYQTVADLKLPVLRLLFEQFEQDHNAARVAAFTTFHEERRELLDRACLFQALREHFANGNPPVPDCTQWPEAYRNRQSAAVHQFAEEHTSSIRFHLWLQWIADAQLQNAAKAAAAMPIGLYRDLAVGAHPSGAEAWSYPGSLVSGADVGAPPDILSASGQDWGLPPLHPIAARETAYRSFIDLLQANMRYAGGLRIDHAMALRRLYWIPKGNEPKDGAYVHYPMEDLLGILALESHRNKCLVVGEDLGTVPEGFRERMAEANVLSYRILSFEKDEEKFVPPHDYPYLGLSVVSNHDLPTLRGWWLERDIDLRDKLGLCRGGSQSARKERARDKQLLAGTFQSEGLIDNESELELEEYSRAVHRFLGRTKCLLTLVQLDDVAREGDQINLPGTTEEHPNWRRRVSVSLEELAAGPELEELSCLMQAERTSL